MSDAILNIDINISGIEEKVDKLEAQFNRINQLTENLKRSSSGNGLGNNLKNEANDVKKSSDDIKKSLEQVEQASSKLGKTKVDADPIKNLGNDFKKAESDVVASAKSMTDSVEKYKSVLSQFPAMTKRVQDHGKAYREMAALNLEDQINQVKALNMQNQLAESNRSLANIKNPVAQKFVNSAIYSASGAVQAGVAREFRDGLAAVKEYELGIVDLRRTMQGVTETDLKNFGNQAIKYAQDFGVPIKEVQDAMTELSRAGVGKGMLNDMTEAVMMGLNTTEIETAEQMVSSLISTTKQLKMDMGDSMGIVDSWNYLADNYAVHTDDFAKAIERSGSASQMLGLDLHDLNAIVTILGESTQASGERIGTAIRALGARLLRPGTIETLEGFGIAVKKNEEEFLSFEEIMNNVHNVIKDMDEDSVAFSQIMDAMGGSWRKNWIAALANDWERFNGLVEEQVNSVGYSARENEIAMDTIDKKLVQLKETWKTAFIDTFERQGYGENLKDFLDGINAGVSGLVNSGALAKLADLTKLLMQGAIGAGVTKKVGSFLGKDSFGALSQHLNFTQKASDKLYDSFIKLRKNSPYEALALFGDYDRKMGTHLAHRMKNEMQLDRMMKERVILQRRQRQTYTDLFDAPGGPGREAIKTRWESNAKALQQYNTEIKNLEAVDKQYTMRAVDRSKEIGEMRRTAFATGLKNFGASLVSGLAFGAITASVIALGDAFVNTDIKAAELGQTLTAGFAEKNKFFDQTLKDVGSTNAAFEDRFGKSFEDMGRLVTTSGGNLGLPDDEFIAFNEQLESLRNIAPEVAAAIDQNAASTGNYANALSAASGAIKDLIQQEANRFLYEDKDDVLRGLGKEYNSGRFLGLGKTHKKELDDSTIFTMSEATIDAGLRGMPLGKTGEELGRVYDQLQNKGMRFRTSIDGTAESYNQLGLEITRNTGLMEQYARNMMEIASEGERSGKITKEQAEAYRESSREISAQAQKNRGMSTRIHELARASVESTTRGFEELYSKDVDLAQRTAKNMESIVSNLDVASFLDKQGNLDTGAVDSMVGRMGSFADMMNNSYEEAKKFDEFMSHDFVNMDAGTLSETWVDYLDHLQDKLGLTEEEVTAFSDTMRDKLGLEVDPLNIEIDVEETRSQMNEAFQSLYDSLDGVSSNFIQGISEKFANRMAEWSPTAMNAVKDAVSTLEGLDWDDTLKARFLNFDSFWDTIDPVTLDFSRIFALDNDGLGEFMSTFDSMLGDVRSALESAGIELSDMDLSHIGNAVVNSITQGIQTQDLDGARATLQSELQSIFSGMGIENAGELAETIAYNVPIELKPEVESSSEGDVVATIEEEVSRQLADAQAAAERLAEAQSVMEGIEIQLPPLEANVEQVKAEIDPMVAEIESIGERLRTAIESIPDIEFDFNQIVNITPLNDMSVTNLTSPLTTGFAQAEATSLGHINNIQSATMGIVAQAGLIQAQFSGTSALVSSLSQSAVGATTSITALSSSFQTLSATATTSLSAIASGSVTAFSTLSSAASSGMAGVRASVTAGMAGALAIVNSYIGSMRAALSVTLPGPTIGPPRKIGDWSISLPGIGSRVPFAEGGIVKARPGGLPALIGEAGDDEAIIPLPKLQPMLEHALLSSLPKMELNITSFADVVEDQGDLLVKEISGFMEGRPGDPVEMVVNNHYGSSRMSFEELKLEPWTKRSIDDFSRAFENGFSGYDLEFVDQALSLINGIKDLQEVRIGDLEHQQSMAKAMRDFRREGQLGNVIMQEQSQLLGMMEVAMARYRDEYDRILGLVSDGGYNAIEWFDHAGKQSMAFVTLIKSFEDAEGKVSDANRKIVDGLNDQFKALEAIKGELSSVSSEYQKMQLDMQKEYYDLVEEYFKDIYDKRKEEIEETYGFQIKATERERDLYKKATDDRIKELKKERDEFDKTINVKVKALKSQLDLMDKEDKERDRQRRLEELEEKVRKAKEALAAIEGERNTIIYKRDVDGYSQHEYVMDPEAYEDAVEKVQEAEEDLAEFRREQIADNSKDAIRDEIDALEKSRDINRDRIDDLIDAQNEERDLRMEHYEKLISGLKAGQDAAMNSLDKWNEYVEKHIYELGQYYIDMFGGIYEAATFFKLELEKLFSPDFNPMSQYAPNEHLAYAMEYYGKDAKGVYDSILASEGRIRSDGTVVSKVDVYKELDRLFTTSGNYDQFVARTGMSEGLRYQMEQFGFSTVTDFVNAQVDKIGKKRADGSVVTQEDVQEYIRNQGLDWSPREAQKYGQYPFTDTMGRYNFDPYFVFGAIGGMDKYFDDQSTPLSDKAIELFYEENPELEWKGEKEAIRTADKNTREVAGLSGEMAEYTKAIQLYGQNLYDMGASVEEVEKAMRQYANELMQMEKKNANNSNTSNTGSSSTLRNQQLTNDLRYALQQFGYGLSASEIDRFKRDNINRVGTRGASGSILTNRDIQSYFDSLGLKWSSSDFAGTSPTSGSGYKPPQTTSDERRLIQKITTSDRTVEQWREADGKYSYYEYLNRGGSMQARNIQPGSANSKYYKDKYGFSQYLDGGVVDQYGPAMLHGHPLHSEVVFSSKDAKKLHDIVGKLPSFDVSGVLGTISNIGKMLPSIISSSMPSGDIVNEFHISKLEFPNVSDGNDVVSTLVQLPRLIKTTGW